MMKRLTLAPLVACALLLSAASTAAAMALFQGGPSYGQAEVDGDPGEWNLVEDHFADLFGDGDPLNGLRARLHLRYDCEAERLYMLVLADVGWQLFPQAEETWLAVADQADRLVDGGSPDFAWATEDESHIGWEGSAELIPGTYLLSAQVLTIADSEAGGEDQAEVGAATLAGDIPLVIDCALPDTVAVDELLVDEDSVTQLDLPAIDEGAEEDPDAPQFQITAPPEHGSLEFSTDGYWVYAPDADFNGQDQFTYEVCEAADRCESDQVNITVLPVNDEPLASADSYSIWADTMLMVGAPGPLANDQDLDGDGLRVASHSEAEHGSVLMTGVGAFAYRPQKGYCGSDTFGYTISDGNEGVAEAQVSLEVACLELIAEEEASEEEPAEGDPVVEEAPLMAADDAYTLEAGSSLIVDAPGVLANDETLIDTGLQVLDYSQAQHGTVAMEADGSFTYTPDADFVGQDIFLYVVEDVNGEYASAAVYLELQPGAQAPVAEVDNCVLEAAYWRLHAGQDPERYDPTWEKMPLGAGRPYLQSGMSYYGILSTDAEGAWYVLAQAHIATQLNILQGAAHAPILEAFNHAVYLLNTNAIDDTLSDELLADFLETAEELASYNSSIEAEGCEQVSESEDNDIPEDGDSASP